jgi:hypothetical protein
MPGKASTHNLDKLEQNMYMPTGFSALSHTRQQWRARWAGCPFDREAWPFDPSRGPNPLVRFWGFLFFSLRQSRGKLAEA